MQLKIHPGAIRAMKRMAYLLYVFFVTLIALEIILHFYNPFHFRIKGNHLLLPVNERLVIRNTINPHLDSVIINNRNSLGFRGPEKPEAFHRFLSVVAVGGSTTECHFLSDNRTWPWLMGERLRPAFPDIWVNNAGFDGQSSFGHGVLLNDYLVKLRPRVILFLTGINEVENDQPTFHDKLNSRGAYSDFKHFIFTNSEALNLVLNVVRGRKAQQLNNTTNELLDLRKGEAFVMTAGQIAERKQQQAKYLAGYRARLNALIDTCGLYGISPVFITQPCLFGEGRDSLTGVNLETFKLKDGFNGKGLWEVLTLYNDALKEVCSLKKVPVIDLAGQVPKNSLYFYDASHFTNEGADKVAGIVAEGFKRIFL